MPSRSFWKGFAAAVVVIAIATLIVLPLHADYRARAQTSEMLVAATAAKSQIEENFMSTGRLSGAGVNVPSSQASPGLLTFASTTADGIILMRGGRDGQVLVLLPERSAGDKLSWRCVGGSASAVPSPCR